MSYGLSFGAVWLKPVPLGLYQRLPTPSIDHVLEGLLSNMTSTSLSNPLSEKVFPVESISSTATAL